MTRWRLALVFALATVAVAIGRPALARADFSEASLKGSYVARSSGHSLFAAAEGSAASPIFVGAVGLLTFDGAGQVSGTVTTSGTEIAAGGEGTTPYSSQVVCNRKIKGTYKVKADGTGSMSINYIPTTEKSACGSSTGTFNLVLISPDVVEYVSTGQSTADPGRGAFFAYVVTGELRRQHHHGEE
jgi:hypothetical protein